MRNCTIQYGRDSLDLGSPVSVPINSSLRLSLESSTTYYIQINFPVMSFNIRRNITTLNGNSFYTLSELKAILFYAIRNSLFLDQHHSCGYWTASIHCGSSVCDGGNFGCYLEGMSWLVRSYAMLAVKLLSCGKPLSSIHVLTTLWERTVQKKHFACSLRNMILG